HSRHRSIHNFIMNLCSALTAYCFFDNKTEVLPVYIEKSKQLELFVY
ncbi:MAG: IS982 family transposase, partial [Prevotella sp.]